MDVPVGPRRRLPLTRIAAVVVAYGLGAAQFVLTMVLLVDLVHVSRGLVAFGGLAGLVVLGLAALSFIIAVPSYYATGERRRTFLARFLLVSGIQGVLFFVLRALHYLVNFFLTPGVLDFLTGGVALAAGVACLVVAGRAFSSAKSRRGAPLEPVAGAGGAQGNGPRQSAATT